MSILSTHGIAVYSLGAAEREKWKNGFLNIASLILLGCLEQVTESHPNILTTNGNKTTPQCVLIKR